MHISTPDHRTIKHAHLFCGLGGEARGFNRATVRVGSIEATFRCLGGIDVDAAAIRDFPQLAGVPGTCLDLFDREQYLAFHGCEPLIVALSVKQPCETVMPRQDEETPCSIGGPA